MSAQYQALTKMADTVVGTKRMEKVTKARYEEPLRELITKKADAVTASANTWRSRNVVI